MKGFYYDTILDCENICNLEQERDSLIAAVEQKKKLVVYGPRNCGKTSLLQSVVIPEFRRKQKKCFVFQVDLMEVRTQEAISQRVQRAFETSFAESFPGKQMFEMAKRFLLSLKPTLEIDPNTGQSSLSLGSSSTHTDRNWADIFDTIRTKIATEYPCLLVIDEFQDISFVDGAQGMMRVALESFKNVPIIVLGSKQHILSNIFAKPRAPLANFGEDLEFSPISDEKYHAYMQERFKDKSLTIEFEDAKRLKKLMRHIPEPINIVCADLYQRLSDQKISWTQIAESIVRVVEGRKARYQTMLALFTPNEEKVLIVVRKRGPIRQPNSKEFLAQVKLSSRAARNIIHSLHDHSFLSYDDEGFQISDPLLGLFIDRYR